MSERVLVVGGSGHIGSTLVRQMQESGYSVEFTYYETDSQMDGLTGHRLDIRDPIQTRDLIKNHHPDVVIHAAAATDVDRCETDREYARAVNLDGTRHVVAGCEQVEAHLVLLSTAYVFGAGKGPYEVADARRPVNTYGESKAAAERVVLSGNLRSTVVRTDQPYGRRSDVIGSDFIGWVLDGLEREDSLEVYDDWYGAPTHVDDISGAIKRIIANHHLGVFHCVGPTYLSRYAWAKRIATVFGYDSSSVEPIPSESDDHPAERPEAELAMDRSYSRLGIDPLSIADGLGMVWAKSGTEI